MQNWGYELIVGQCLYLKIERFYLKIAVKRMTAPLIPMYAYTR